MREHNDLVLELPNFVPQSLCKKMIQAFEKTPNKSPGEVVYDNKISVIPEQKNSLDCCICSQCLPDAEHESKECIKFIQSAIELYRLQLKNEYEYKQKMHTFEPMLSRNVNYDEINPAIHKQPRGGKYAWHFDYRDGCDNFAMVMIYLNTLEPEEGGCTEFGNGRKVRPECGKVVIWPASWAYPHCGNEVKCDSKYTIVTTLNMNKLTES